MSKIDIAEQITCVRREIAMRETVYPKRVAAKKMKQEMADRELARMRAVLATLVSLEALYAEPDLMPGKASGNG